MSDILRCLDTSDDLREELRTGARHLTLALQDGHGAGIDVAVTLRSVRQLRDGGEHVVFVMPCAHFVTVALPAPANDHTDVEVLDPGHVIDFINNTGKIDWSILALEQYLRWQEDLIVRGTPRPAGPGAYAQHPVLHALPIEVRNDLADLLCAGRRISAVKTLRENLPGLGLKDAKVFVDALERFC